VLAVVWTTKTGSGDPESAILSINPVSDSKFSIFLFLFCESSIPMAASAASEPDAATLDEPEEAAAAAAAVKPELPSRVLSGFDLQDLSSPSSPNVGVDQARLARAVSHLKDHPVPVLKPGKAMRGRPPESPRSGAKAPACNVRNGGKYLRTGGWMKPCLECAVLPLHAPEPAPSSHACVS
jgi:hypothetical protein